MIKPSHVTLRTPDIASMANDADCEPPFLEKTNLVMEYPVTQVSKQRYH